MAAINGIIDDRPQILISVHRGRVSGSGDDRSTLTVIPDSYKRPEWA